MKKTYLLDTNIVSEFTKERPDEQVIDFYNARRELCAISSITWQEIVRGISRMPEGKRKNNLKSFLNDLDLNMDVISFDKFSAQICGEIQAAAEKALEKQIKSIVAEARALGEENSGEKADSGALTVFSAKSDFQENHSYLCSSVLVVAFLESWQAEQSKTSVTAA